MPCSSNCALRCRCHHFAPLPTCCSLRIRHCVAKTAFQTLCQSVSQQASQAPRGKGERADERPATAESTAEASSTWTCRLSPLPPPPTDDTKRRRQRSNELFLLPFFKAPRSVEPNSDLGLPLPLQETDSSARSQSQSHYCAMGTYHFAPPTRRRGMYYELKRVQPIAKCNVDMATPNELIPITLDWLL